MQIKAMTEYGVVDLPLLLAIATAMEDLETAQERVVLLVREALKRGEVAIAVEG